MHRYGYKAFTEYSNDIDDIYESIEECNPNTKCKVLIVLVDMIANMLSNNKLQQIILLYQKYFTKFYTLFYYQNFKQARDSSDRK